MMIKISMVICERKTKSTLIVLMFLAVFSKNVKGLDMFKECLVNTH